MGRGRQKAKQTKVARRLKYGGPEPDLEALERELSGKGREPESEDPYAKYADPDYDKWSDYDQDDPYAKYADYAEYPKEEESNDSKHGA